MTVFEQHNKAMDLAEQAFRLAQQSPELSQELFKQAYHIERAIADTIEAIEENEPSRSIFYKSAASLALNAKLFREAEISACLGIAGVGDSVELNELRDIFDQVNFERHLHLNGVDLENNQFQLSFVGNEVGSGYIKSSELINRLTIITDLARKEIEKKAKKTFNSKGRPSKVVQMYPLYFSAGMTGSYKIIIRIGEPKINQPLIGGKYETEKNVIKSIIKKISYVNADNIDALKAEYGVDDPYYDFFIESIKSFAPDGDKIKMIGFTATVDGEKVETQLTRRSNEIGRNRNYEDNFDLDANEEGKIISIEGILDLSKSRNSTHVFEVMTDDGQSYKFEASEGELASIVRDNYKDLVKVTGKRKKGKKEIYMFMYIEKTE